MGNADREPFAFGKARLDQELMPARQRVEFAKNDAGAKLLFIRFRPEWNKPEDTVKFLDDCNPELFTGDPVALEHLARLPVSSRPKAIVSSAMSLRPAMKQLLESRFNCSVLDMTLDVDNLNALSVNWFIHAEYFGGIR